MFKFILLFSTILFSLNANIQEITIDKNKEFVNFNENNKELILKLLNSKNISTFFISKKILNQYYKESNYELFWINKKGTLKPISLELLSNIKSDPVLKPHANKSFKINLIIDSLANLEKTPEKYQESLIKIDFILIGIYNKYMTYLSNGFIKWYKFKNYLKSLNKKYEIIADWEKHNAKQDFKKLLLLAMNENNLNIAFDSVNFTYPEATKLMKEILDHEEIFRNGGFIKIPKSKVLKLGEKNPIIKTLRERLIQSKDLLNMDCKNEAYNEEINIINNERKDLDVITYGSDTIENSCLEFFDEDVKNAVLSFQKKHGLFEDGIVGPQTKKYLNIPVQKKLIKMRLNLERMRWLPRKLGKEFILVNIPEYKLKMYEDNKIKLNMSVVVGNRSHPTPIFSDKISFIVLNPYWKIPQRIVKREIIPKLKNNPSYLINKGINIHENWDYNSSKIDSLNIDWSEYQEENKKEESSYFTEQNYIANNYRFIQIPSSSNPLGRMKFMFPNKYSVYMHDTPAKSYFKHRKRAYSHGCIRLEKPKELLQKIAENDGNLNYNNAKKILKNIDKKQISLRSKIPVHMVYLTSWVDEEGNLQFRDDIYGYDKIQKKLLYSKNQFM